MASMRDIKRRKESVQSTQQITKAMKLVSTVKLQKARGRAESNKPYFNMLYDTICSILAMTKEPNHKFLKENGSDKKAVIAITSNRGLAGGYNNNVVKEIVAAGFSKEDTYIYGIGKKGIEGLTRKGYSIYQDESEIINAPLFDDATELTKQLLTQYSKGEIGEVYIAYTCSCFNQFMNSVYVVNKKSQRSMVTMMAGAISNCLMNYFFIKWWGPVGATYASFLGLGLVFTLRAMDAHGMIGMHVHPGRVLVNAAALVFEAFVLLADTPLYGLWTGIITALIILYNFSGVWAMARILLPKILGRRGKALVAVVDGWAAKK